MISLLQQLIAIPSLSRDEGAVADFLEAWLTKAGLAPHRCGNNLWCSAGQGPVVLLDAHIDTVKPVAGWTRDPFAPTLEDGRPRAVATPEVVAAAVGRQALLREPGFQEVGYCSFIPAQ